VIAYTGDTEWTDDVAKVARGTDLLIDGGATAWHVNGAGYARGSTPGGAGDLETVVGGVSPAPFGRRG